MFCVNCIITLPLNECQSLYFYYLPIGYKKVRKYFLTDFIPIRLHLELYPKHLRRTLTHQHTL